MHTMSLVLRAGLIAAGVVSLFTAGDFDAAKVPCTKDGLGHRSRDDRRQDFVERPSGVNSRITTNDQPLITK